MTISNEKLRVEVGVLKSENSDLKVEIDGLKVENNGFKVENAQLRAENQHLKVSKHMKEVNGMRNASLCIINLPLLHVLYNCIVHDKYLL